MNLQREFATINGKLDEIAKNTEPEELELESLGEWLDEWLDLYKVGQIKDSTIYQYRLMIKRIPEPLKLKPLGKLQPRELQRFLYSIRQTRQRQHVYCLLKDAFHKAFVLRMLEFDPMLAVEKPKHVKKNAKHSIGSRKLALSRHATVQSMVTCILSCCIRESARERRSHWSVGTLICTTVCCILPRQ